LNQSTQSRVKKQLKKRYYITSMSASAKKILRAARSHWLIENSLHWVLDVSFNDDQSRIRKGNASQNIATIKSVALNLLNLAKPSISSRISIKRLRKLAGWKLSILDFIQI
jgi:predicted transposase YbfD/YdcC